MCVKTFSKRDNHNIKILTSISYRAYFQGGDGTDWQEDGGGKADVFEVFDDEGHGVHLKGVVFCTGKNN